MVISAPIGAGQSTAVLDLKDGSGTVLAHYQIDATTTSYSSNGAHYVYVMLEPVEPPATSASTRSEAAPSTRGPTT